MKRSDIKIFDFQPQDADDILRIQAKTGLSVWSKNDYLSEAEREDSIFKVGKNATKGIIGFALVRLLIGNSDVPDISFNSSEILNIAVCQSFQRQGVGQMLFDEILQELRIKKIKEIWLEVRESNAKAIHFYKRNNFEMQFERKNYYSDPAENALVFRRLLEKSD